MCTYCHRMSLPVQQKMYWRRWERQRPVVSKLPPWHLVWLNRQSSFLKLKRKIAPISTPAPSPCGPNMLNEYFVRYCGESYFGPHRLTEFTGDLRNCDACHVNGSQNVPTPDGALPTITNNAWWTPMQPDSAACLSCHDDDDSAAHAYSNTAFFGESCSTCHGEGKEAAVDKVHAQ